MLIVSFGAGSLKFQIVIKISKQPPKPAACRALEDPHETFNFGQPQARYDPLLPFDCCKAQRQLPGLSSHRARKSTAHESGSTRHIYGASLLSLRWMQRPPQGDRQAFQFCEFREIQW